jgi:simple sugar transport system permease protein
VLLSAVVRVLTGVTNLTSAGTVAAALGLSVPIAMAGLGGLWAERAGVVNIGLEGMMILGTFGAGWAGYQWGPWVGLVVAVAAGALGGLLHALATVTFAVDQIVSGVAINILPSVSPSSSRPSCSPACPVAVARSRRASTPWAASPSRASRPLPSPSPTRAGSSSATSRASSRA